MDTVMQKKHYARPKPGSGPAAIIAPREERLLRCITSLGWVGLLVKTSLNPHIFFTLQK